MRLAILIYLYDWAGLVTAIEPTIAAFPVSPFRLLIQWVLSSIHIQVPLKYIDQPVFRNSVAIGGGSLQDHVGTGILRWESHFLS